MSLPIDHIVIAVPDLDRAARSWTGAGFVVTPRADHPFGTSNRLVVFDSSYVELVSVTRPALLPAAGFAADVAGRLAHSGAGITHLALRTDDAVAEAEARATAVFEFSRPAPMIDGTTMQASFSLVVLDDESRPGLFFCQHHTPDAVWADTHTAHANGARRIVAVSLAGPAPNGLDGPEAISGCRFGAGRDTIETDGGHESFAVGEVEVRPRSAVF